LGSEDDFVHARPANLYFWYYGTLAMFRVGGDAWKRWNVAMKETLPPAQASRRLVGADLDVYASTPATTTATACTRRRCACSRSRSTTATSRRCLKVE
jgi:hypothetical protein